MKHLAWDKTDTARRGGEGDTQFLKLKAGETYKLRCVGRPVGYLQHWEPVICRSPGKDPETKQIIDPLMLKGFEPKERYAIWVLNRKENNILQVVDFPGTLLEQFVRWKDEFGDEPGGLKGPDWKISLEIPPGADKRRTKYVAMNLDRTPFTDEEKALFTKMGGGDGLRAKLAELRRDNTPDEINEMLARKQGGGQGGSTQKSEQKQQSEQAQQSKEEFTKGEEKGDLGF